MENTNMNIWVTTDLHLYHNRDFLYEPRGFTSAESHAKAIVRNWNRIVQPEDIVYVLGDCVLNDDAKGITMLKQLNGTKYLAIGNHDSDARLKRYEEAKIFADMQFAYRLTHKGMKLYLTHYPTMTGNFDSHNPTFNISGHTHNQDKWDLWEHGIYNAALDAHNNTPVNLDTIVSDIRTKLTEK